MKHYLISIAVAAIALVGCSKKQSVEPTTKSLVIYYSQTGTTKALAEEIRKQVGADIEQIEAEVPYDGDFGATVARCQQEMAEGSLPVIKPITADISKYDTIYIGYPVWFGQYALPMASLIANIDLSGKKVIPFCSFGSGGLNSTTDALRKDQPNADVLEGYGVRTARVNRIAKEVPDFLKRNGYIEGAVPALTEFSEQQPVTEAESTIFEAACGNYQFPLGKPLTFGTRDIEEGKEYKFVVVSAGREGEESTSTIYVICYNEEGLAPEFTQVVR